MKYALLVPCYNAAAYIDKFLENVASLTVKFDEVIFYDDGSTDKTAQLLLAKQLNVIQGEVNKGPGYARNKLAESASSPYIHFHDIDDEFNPEFLQLVKRRMALGQNEVVLGNADWLDASTRELVIKWRYNEAEIQNGPLTYFISHPLGIINTVYRRDFFLKICFFCVYQ